MSLTPAQLRAQFSWEAACERLRNALLYGAPPSPADMQEVRHSLMRVRDSYLELCEAFDVDQVAMVPPPPGVRSLQRRARSLRGRWRRLKDWLGID